MLNDDILWMVASHPAPPKGWLKPYRWGWVKTYRYIFNGVNIHLPAILGFTRYQGFDPSPDHGRNKPPFSTGDNRISLGPSTVFFFFKLGDLREFDGQGGYSTLVGGFKHLI